jgi:hypothetical protein
MVLDECCAEINHYNLMTMKEVTKKDIEELRGGISHMILFAMAWVLIGEYALHFRDYAAGAAVLLVVVVRLALYSVKLYQLEERLPAGTPTADPREKRRGDLFILIFVFEGAAVLVTWMVLLNIQRTYWMIPCFAFIAGAHFFPLARLFRQPSYYILGAWICVVAVAGYLMLFDSGIRDYAANTLVAYGCAVGAVVNGVWIMLRARRLSRGVGAK